MEQVLISCLTDLQEERGTLLRLGRGKKEKTTGLKRERWGNEGETGTYPAKGGEKGPMGMGGSQNERKHISLSTRKGPSIALLLKGVATGEKGTNKRGNWETMTRK